MIKVAGLWELGWNSPLAESYLWTFVLREFEIKKWYMSPVSGIQINEQANVLELEEHRRLETLLDLEENQELTRVFVDEKGETPLPEFEHPEDALYIFGKAGVSTLRQYGTSDDLSIRIPTRQNSGVLWPHQCLLTVLYDRETKRGRNTS